MQQWVIRGSGAGSRDPLLTSATPCPLRKTTARESCACSSCGAFDAAFAKSVWPLFYDTLTHLGLNNGYSSSLYLQTNMLLICCMFYIL